MISLTYALITCRIDGMEGMMSVKFFSNLESMEWKHCISLWRYDMYTELWRKGNSKSACLIGVCLRMLLWSMNNVLYWDKYIAVLPSDTITSRFSISKCIYIPPFNYYNLGQCYVEPGQTSNIEICFRANGFWRHLDC